MTAQASRAPQPAGRHVLRVFLFAFVLFAYFMPRWADWNIDSRFDLVRAIVDRHSLSIDAYHWNTWDKALYRGHYYSDKAPGTAVLGAAVYAGYAVARHAPVLGGAVDAIQRSAAWNVPIAIGKTSTQRAPAARGTTLGGCQRAGSGNVQYIPWGNRLVPPMRDWALSRYVVTIGTIGLPSAAFLAFLFWFMGFFAASVHLRWLLVVLYGAGTVALPYSTLLYSHQLSAALLFTAFCLLFLRRQRRAGRWAGPLAGFLLGFSLFTEYTVALVVACVAIYGLWSLRRPMEIAGACVTGAIPIGGLLAYNRACFGGILDTGYSHDFCWSSAQAAGYAGFTYPHLGPLWDLTFGSYRGLFYLSPFLLLALPGAWWMWRRGFRVESALCIGVSVLFILTLSAYWGWNGGKVEGPRYLVPVIPFLAFPVLFVLERFRPRSRWWGMVALLAAWSLATVWIEFLGGYQFPTSWLRNPIPDYSWPYLTANQIPPNAGFFLGLAGWQSLVPLAILLVAVVVCPPVHLRRVPSSHRAAEFGRA